MHERAARAARASRAVRLNCGTVEPWKSVPSNTRLEPASSMLVGSAADAEPLVLGRPLVLQLVNDAVTCTSAVVTEGQRVLSYGCKVRWAMVSDGEADALPS